MSADLFEACSGVVDHFEELLMFGNGSEERDRTLSTFSESGCRFRHLVAFRGIAQASTLDAYVPFGLEALHQHSSAPR